jgi:hypothetical protein
VTRGDGISVCSGNRYKKRISLVDYGKPFMDLTRKTPLEALKAIYDLLESESVFDMLLFPSNPFWGEQPTRLLYFKRNVLC